MKFSYTLLKKLYSAIESKEKLAETLTNHVFEVEEIVGNTLQVAILPNRYGDAGGHLGLAAEAAAAVGRKFSWPEADFSVEKTDKLFIGGVAKKTCFLVCETLSQPVFELRIIAKRAVINAL